MLTCRTSTCTAIATGAVCHILSAQVASLCSPPPREINRHLPRQKRKRNSEASSSVMMFTAHNQQIIVNSDSCHPFSEGVRVLSLIMGSPGS